MRINIFIVVLCALGVNLNIWAQTCNDSIPYKKPNEQYIVNEDNTITDTETGLTWMKCSLGQTGEDCSGGSLLLYTWQDALQAAEAHEYANKSDWRLPNIAELKTLTEKACFLPAINETIFPLTSSSYYWSSSPVSNVLGDKTSSIVNFEHGTISSVVRTQTAYVRLVRD